ncbi:MAG: hypothetical protein HY525_03335 [Betaproteobacteria bacterium]|nr:hypothetical protein [Betaproteobacteria bacterium]
MELETAAIVAPPLFFHAALILNHGEHRQFPAIECDVVAHDIYGTVIAFDLEVAVIGRKPAIQYFNRLDHAFSQVETPRRLLAAVAGVALNAD